MVKQELHFALPAIRNLVPRAFPLFVVAGGKRWARDQPMPGSFPGPHEEGKSPGNEVEPSTLTMNLIFCGDLERRGILKGSTTNEGGSFKCMLYTLWGDQVNATV